MPLRERWFQFPRSVESSERLAMRVFAGVLFTVLGSVKFFYKIPLGTDAITVPSGPEGFAMFLDAMSIPFPLFNAYLVCLTEMIGGAVLIASAFVPQPYSPHLTRLTALPLVVDMAVAFTLVGMRNVLGMPVRIHDIAVGAQSWRMPLEALLLVIVVYLLLKPLPSVRLRLQSALA